MSGLSTKHVVLGLLADRTSYGYALQQQLADRFGFLGLAESAIYKTLERLEFDGCVEQAGEKHVGRTSRVLYRVTPEGVEEFRRWMAEPTGQAPVREELHAKLVLAGPEDLPQLSEVVEAQAQACLAELAELGRGPRRQVDPGPLRWDATARLLVEDFKAYRLESLVDWLAEVGDAIQHFLDSEAAQTEGLRR
jgi:DNA-binding PadR family transcriptional regulator